MSTNRASSKPLEWKFAAVGTTDATVTNEVVELGLRDDEVAEVWKVESLVDFGNIPDAANDEVQGDMALSMDPDVVADPSVAANQQDLEWFYFDRSNIQQEVGAAGTAIIEKAKPRSVDFNPPILVGTDIGMVVKGDAAILCDFWVRVYFTRRRANVSELNQILLKRR